MNFFELMRLKNKPCLNQVVQNRKGQRFRCSGGGMARYEGEYQMVLHYTEFNTEEVPMTFTITPLVFNEVVESGRLKCVG